MKKIFIVKIVTIFTSWNNLNNFNFIFCLKKKLIKKLFNKNAAPSVENKIQIT